MVRRYVICAIRIGAEHDFVRTDTNLTRNARNTVDEAMAA